MASSRQMIVRGKCPICKHPTDAHYRPFCSRRCADIDLGRWMTGNYAIPGGTDDADEDGDEAAARHSRGDGRGGRTDEDE